MFMQATKRGYGYGCTYAFVHSTLRPEIYARDVHASKRGLGVCYARDQTWVWVCVCVRYLTPLFNRLLVMCVCMNMYVNPAKRL